MYFAIADLPSSSARTDNRDFLAFSNFPTCKSGIFRRMAMVVASEKYRKLARRPYSVRVFFLCLCVGVYQVYGDYLAIGT